MLWHVPISAIWFILVSENFKIAWNQEISKPNLVKVSDFDGIKEYVKEYNALNEIVPSAKSPITSTDNEIENISIDSKARNAANANFQYDKNFYFGLKDAGSNDLLSKIMEYNALKRKLRKLTAAFKQRCNSQNYDEFVDGLVNNCMISLRNSRKQSSKDGEGSDTDSSLYQPLTNVPTPTQLKPGSANIQNPNEDSRRYVGNKICFVPFISNSQSSSSIKFQPVPCEAFMNSKNDIVTLDDGASYTNANNVQRRNPYKSLDETNSNYVDNSETSPTPVEARYISKVLKKLRNNYIPMIVQRGNDRPMSGIFFPIRMREFPRVRAKRLKSRIAKRNLKYKKRKRSRARLKKNSCSKKELQYLRKAKHILHELTKFEFSLNRQTKSPEITIMSPSDNGVLDATNALSQHPANSTQNVFEQLILVLYDEVLDKVKELNNTIHQYQLYLEENPHHEDPIEIHPTPTHPEMPTTIQEDAVTQARRRLEQIKASKSVATVSSFNLVN